MLDLSVLESALYIQLGVAFLAGFLTFFTPCVYPLVPITIAIFSGPPDHEGNHGTCKIKSLLYAAGIATTYTILGILAAQFGLVFGAYIGSPIFLAMITIVLIALTFSTVGIMELPFLHQLQNIGCKIKSSGKRGAFLTGLGSGLIAAPCVGPTLVTILTLAASHQQPLLGSTMMASYALGFSLPFIALSSCGQLLQKLPQCGTWMGWVKGIIASGIILTLMFLFSGHVDWSLTYLAQKFSIATIVAVGFAGLLLIYYASKSHRPWISLVGCITLATALYAQFLYMPIVSKQNQLKWASSLPSAVAQSQENSSKNTLIVVKSYADWCGSCRELEEKTFGSQHVQNTLKHHVLVGIDFSELTSEVNKFSNDYNVVGVPTILFLKQDGSEIPNSRISGFVTAQQFVTHVEHLLSNNTHS